MTVEFRLPDIGEGIAEGEIVKWLVHPGDTVHEDQPIVEVMTDKVTAEIPSPFSGVVKELKAKEGETVKVGSVLVLLDKTSGESDVAPVPSQLAQKQDYAQYGNGKTTSSAELSRKEVQPATLAAVGSSKTKMTAAPATRRIARELGVDLSKVTGSGPKGRITPMDVKEAIHKTASLPERKKEGRSQTEYTETRIPFTGMRRKIAEHLVHAKQTAPHFAYVEEVDMTEIIRMREELLPVANEKSIRLSYLPFIIKAVIAGLREYPMMNASLDEDKQEIVHKGYYNIGVAVATDHGLIVPVIHGADGKSLLQLAQEIQFLSSRARDNKLALEDLKGGTFTLTSIGSIGGLFSVPILNAPEVGILGINKITKRPVVRNNEIVIRDIMYLSLSCDHRVVDGADAARFIRSVIEILEQPARLLL